VFKRPLISILVWLCLLPAAAWGAPGVKTPSVMFLSPGDLSEFPFWHRFIEFMRAAADDLGIPLRVVPSDNRFLLVDNARAALAEEKPDYALFIYQTKTTVDLLPLLERAGVKSMLCNTRVLDAERKEIGRPRGKYAHWIGQISPDDREAGRALAELLVARAEALGLAGRDGKIHVACVGANVASSAALHRETGMREALDHDRRVVVDRFVRADWRRRKACYKTTRMLDMYPEARVYWSACDNTALGVLDAAEAKGMTPCADFLTGGIDWSDEGVRAVREGRMEASLGGHFMEGAWALIMILDHYNGHDFASHGATRHSHMRRIDRRTLDRYLPALDRSNWPRIDFKRFSKTYNPGLKTYDFTPEAVIRQLHGK